jgi:nicotinate-nucleotide adenylyltransferase
MQKKIGIFGGSFNPIHIGHLALANYLCEYGWVDEVWFLVSPQNPLKPQGTLMDDNKRLALVQTAMGDYPHFKASDFEFQLPRPSYTVHTLAALRKAYPKFDFQLIIGSDNWLLFDRWFQGEEILKQHSILVYPRPGYPVNPSKLPVSVHLTDAPVLEVSSTFIREGLEKGKDLRFFLPPKVYEQLQEDML